MAIPTREALSGFIATDPQLTETSNGGHRFYARVGIEQFQRNDDGSFTQLESEFTNIVMFDKAAKRAAEKFQKGDNFIAEGRSNVHEYQGEQREQFIASRIGHDNNLTTYAVERRSAEREAETRDTPEREAAQHDAPEAPSDDPVAAVLAQRQEQVAPEPAAAGATGPASREAVAR